MDLNVYALERMVEARVAEAREARRCLALAASPDTSARAAGEARRARRRDRRFLRWFFGVPGRTAAQESPP